MYRLFIITEQKFSFEHAKQMGLQTDYVEEIDEETGEVIGYWDGFLLYRLGFDYIEQHDSQMGKLMFEMAAQRNYLEVVNNDETADRGAVISVKMPACDNLDEVSRILSDSYGIMCRNGHLCAQPYVSAQATGQVLRISAYIYNTPSEIQSFFDALDELSHMMFY